MDSSRRVGLPETRTSSSDASTEDMDDWERRVDADVEVCAVDTDDSDACLGSFLRNRSSSVNWFSGVLN